jgi:hypothetical protein
VRIKFSWSVLYNWNSHYNIPVFTCNGHYNLPLFTWNHHNNLPVMAITIYLCLPETTITIYLCLPVMAITIYLCLRISSCTSKTGPTISNTTIILQYILFHNMREIHIERVNTLIMNLIMIIQMSIYLYNICRCIRLDSKWCSMPLSKLLQL